MNHQINKRDNTLSDGQGNRVGQVNPDGTVRDGYRDRGTIDAGGRYHDQYGRDLGWTTSNSGGSDASAGCAAGIVVVLAMLGFGLVSKLLSTPSGRKAATTMAVIATLLFGLVSVCFVGASAVYFVFNIAQANTASQEMAQVRANPQIIATISRGPDVDCGAVDDCCYHNCQGQAAVYVVRNNFKALVLNVEGEILGPGQSHTQYNYGTAYAAPACFRISAIQKLSSGDHEFDLPAPLCYQP